MFSNNRTIYEIIGGVLAVVFTVVFFLVGRGGANQTIDDAQATSAALQNTVGELLDAPPPWPDLSDDLEAAEAEIDALGTQVAEFQAIPTQPPVTTTPEPTATATVAPTAEPTAEPTAKPIVVTLKTNVTKYLLRQVCFNINGFSYNNKGFPIISDCIYPVKGAVSDRIKYFANNGIQVEEFGDAVFAAVHGFATNNGEALVKADGGGFYYVAVQRGANGELLFVASWLLVGHWNEEGCYPNGLDEVVVILDPSLDLWYSLGENKVGKMIMAISIEDEYSIGETFLVFENLIVVDGGSIFYEVFEPDKGLFVKSDDIKLFDPNPDLFLCNG